MPNQDSASANSTALEVGHVTPILRVSNIEASLEYYMRALGFALEWRDGPFGSSPGDLGILPAVLRQMHKEGKLDSLAEFAPQYAGLPPASPELDQYWSLAEELEIPVGIHMGLGPPVPLTLASRNIECGSATLYFSRMCSSVIRNCVSTSVMPDGRS